MPAAMPEIVDRKTVVEAQRARLNRLYMAITTYGVVFFAIYMLQNLGLGAMSQWAFTAFVGYAVAVNAAFYCLIRGGYNLRFKDPGLTLAQILAATVWAWLPFFHFHEARVICQMLFLPAFSFGMLQLDLKQYSKVVAAMIVVYASAVAADYLTGRTGFFFEIEIFQGLLFLLVLLWFALFGGFVSSLRQRLRDQNEALEQARTLIEEQTRTDELTRLYNRQFAMSVLEAEQRKAARIGQVFSVTVIDIDHFKHINDRYGHDAGDTVLRRFSLLASGVLRSGDVLALAREPSTFARYDGEEFLLILPGANEAQAGACLERLQLSLPELDLPGLDAPLTFSAGIAEYVIGESVDALLKRAGDALDRAKGDGRNRVCIGARPRLGQVTC